jgi:hypothetical protein
MGFDLDLQHSGTLPGGLRIEMGEATVSDPTQTMVATQFTKLLGGIAVGEATDYVSGYPASICEGSNIAWVLSDSTETSWTTATMNYIAWGY